VQALRAILDLPRRQQAAALGALRSRIQVPADEAWNTRFGAGSLFDAWTRTTVMSHLYAANRQTLAPVVSRPGFRIIEIGGGNGRLWEGLLTPDSRGEVVVVDPVPEVHDEVASVFPPGVRAIPVLARVEAADLPPADAAVCSLVLHHVAGADAAERARHGLAGPGKREVLQQLGVCVAARAGFVLLNEADVYCDVGLAPGDPILEDRLIDSYVRRCGRAILDDLPGLDGADALRLEAVLWRWCVDQVALSKVPRPDRDVYELDVPRWLALFESAGLLVEERGFTDDYGLFCQYVLRGY
jgi:hypothetical protein